MYHNTVQVVGIKIGIYKAEEQDTCTSTCPFKKFEIPNNCPIT